MRSLEWLNFFLADVQTGLGPFLPAYLASSANGTVILFRVRPGDSVGAELRRAMRRNQEQTSREVYAQFDLQAPKISDSIGVLIRLPFLHWKRRARDS
jgi:hypothetical protein